MTETAQELRGGESGQLVKTLYRGDRRTQGRSVQLTLSDLTGRLTSGDLFLPWEPRLYVTSDGVAATGKTPASPSTVFPSVTLSDEHPVQRQEIIITVGLSKDPSPGVYGSVDLTDSDPDKVHEIRVHLLFAGSSQWDSLRYSNSLGTIKYAEFVVLLPALPEGAGSVPKRAILDLAVNFYLDVRWCGEALKRIEVRAHRGIAMGDPPRVEEPDWRKIVSVEPGATPPDLLVRIQTSDLGYLWTCLSPHASLLPAKEADSLRPVVEAPAFIKSNFDSLVTEKLVNLDIAGVNGAGERIYQATPAVFKNAYWKLYHASQTEGFTFETIQIVTDEWSVPWELMRVSDDKLGPDVAPEFLAIRHSVGRWLADTSCRLTQRIEVTDLAVFATNYEGFQVDPKLPWAELEGEFLVELHGIRYPVKADPLQRFLEGSGANAVHFACHGKMNLLNPDQSLLILEDDQTRFTPLVVARSEVRKGLGQKHPLVFLNACHVGGAGSDLSLVAGFPAAFLSVGAAAIVGPLWTVLDPTALEVTKQFYRAVLQADGETIGAALKRIRSQWADKGHLTYLAYVLYGDPMARVVYRGSPLPAADEAAEAS
jgi:hypothetical protein